jgi:hypothetical protein
MSDPAPVVGRHYRNVIGDLVLVKALDLQNGKVDYEYTDNNHVVTGVSITNFNIAFAPALTIGEQKELDNFYAAAGIYSTPGIEAIKASAIAKLVCECGLDKTGSGGNHSSWCPKNGVA